MHRILFILTCILFAGCTEDERIINLSHTWYLSSVSGMVPYERFTPPFMDTISFGANNTFIRVRYSEVDTFRSTGTYIYFKEGSGGFIVLEHQTTSPVIDNCSESLQEELFVNGNSLIIGGSSGCDGLVLYYSSGEK